MSKLKPLISIIVPVFNNEDTIRRCVDSVRQQSYKNTEIILVDDGSTDNCGAICDEYEKMDERVRVIHKQNGGQSSARNCGLDIARGSLIGFVDSDDFISSVMYEKLHNLLIENEAQIACAGILVTDGGAVPLFTYASDSGDVNVFNREDALEEHLNNTKVTSSLCDKLYHYSIFQDVRMIEDMIYEDLEVLPRCIAKSRKIVYSSEPLYNYVMTSQSTMRGEFSIRQFDMMKAARLRAEFYETECPAHSTRAWGIYIELCLYLIHRSERISEYARKREEAIVEVERIRKKIGNRQLMKKTLVKILLLKLGPTIFALIMSSYQSISEKAFWKNRKRRT